VIRTKLAAMNIPQALGYTRLPACSGHGVLTRCCFRCWHLRYSVRRGYLVVGADSATAAILAAGSWGYGARRQREICGAGNNVALITAGFLLLGASTQARASWPTFLSQDRANSFLTRSAAFSGWASPCWGQMVGLEVHSKRTVGQLFEVFRSLHPGSAASVGYLAK